MQEIWHLLSEKGGDLTDGELSTLLSTACKLGHYEVVQLLLGVGANVNHQVDPDGSSPLHDAVRESQERIVNFLLEQKDININQANAAGESALFIACQRGNSSIVKALLDHGADPNQAAESTVRPLLAASLFGHTDCVKLLLQRDTVDVNSTIRNQATAIILASQQGHASVVDLLLRHGARINQETIHGDTPLHVAAQNGRVQVVHRLLQEVDVDVNKPQIQGFTPLHAACRNGSAPVVDLLLQHGAHVNSRNQYHNTPLHYASFHGYTRIVHRLMQEKESDLFRENGLGKTALCMAQSQGHEGIVNLLERATLVSPAA
jgi:ankyrin repeat protein